MSKVMMLVEWHSPDQMYAAVFVREGEPWFLNGALVGMGGTHGRAVEDLVGIATHLVIEGANFLMESPLSLEDRIWLFKLLDPGSHDDAMYKALREAGVERL